MKRAIIILIFFLLLAGCDKNNPVSPLTDTVQSENLNVTFSIPQSSYGIHDTLKAITTVFNPGDTTVNFYVAVCWPISWYSVQQDWSGATRLSYKAPQSYGCNSLIKYSILPHQSKQIFLLSVAFAIANLDSTQSAQGSYVLTVDDEFGKFSLKFNVN
jgi:hypothetical protein